MSEKSNSIRYYSGNIKNLRENECFVFGANQSGFHGAGSAGYASFNLPGNQWRKFDYANKPDGWKGVWNVKGQTGPMTGVKGKSYGLITVTKPGAKQSISPQNLKSNILEFYRKAESRPEFTFLVAQSHQPGLNGYSGEEMAIFFATADAGHIPANIIFQKEFVEIIAGILKIDMNSYELS